MEKDLYEIHWADSNENIFCSLFKTAEEVHKFLDENHLRYDDVFIFVPGDPKPIVATDFER
jgi:hypothetical protein